MDKRTGLFFILLLLSFDMWLAEGSPPSLLLTQGPEALACGSAGRFQGFFIIRYSLTFANYNSILFDFD